MFCRKVSIIGAGSVGSATAYSLALTAQASEIVLVDINYEKAVGEALDIYHGTPLMDTPVNIYAGSYSDTKDSDIIIITSGAARKAGQSRLDLTRTNVKILKEITPLITAVCPKATYVIVSNPVDILTYAFEKFSGLPENQVLGTGTLLDTARLRAQLSRLFTVSQRNVHAYVLGEHGDSSFVPWSIADISSVPALDYAASLNSFDAVPILRKEEIESAIKTSGAEIIRRKGCTNYAIATTVGIVCETLYAPLNSISTVSTTLHGEYGIEDVALSIPTLMGNGRVHGHVLPALTDEEIARLHRSADALQSVISDLGL